MVGELLENNQRKTWELNISKGEKKEGILMLFKKFTWCSTHQPNEGIIFT